jgi:hypothetical protein
MWLLFKEEFEDTKGVIRINISGVEKKDRHPLNINGALSAKIVNFCYP